MAQIEAGGTYNGRRNRSQPVVRIADEHGDGMRAQITVDSGKFHLTKRDCSAYRPADHSRTISICSDRSEAAVGRKFSIDSFIYFILINGIRSEISFRARDARRALFLPHLLFKHDSFNASLSFREQRSFAKNRCFIPFECHCCPILRSPDARRILINVGEAVERSFDPRPATELTLGHLNTMFPNCTAEEREPSDPK
jgi:hypothetical protein